MRVGLGALGRASWALGDRLRVERSFKFIWVDQNHFLFSLFFFFPSSFLQSPICLSKQKPFKRYFQTKTNLLLFYTLLYSHPLFFLTTLSTNSSKKNTPFAFSFLLFPSQQSYLLTTALIWTTTTPTLLPFYLETTSWYFFDLSFNKTNHGSIRWGPTSDTDCRFGGLWSSTNLLPTPL